MSAFLVCHVVGQNARGGITTRARLSQRIARLWDGTLQLDATWIVEADKTSDEIRDELTDCLSDGDALLVVGASIDAAWAGFRDADCDWLVDHMSRAFKPRMRSGRDAAAYYGEPLPSSPANSE
jgi:hypothetical protein